MPGRGLGGRLRRGRGVRLADGRFELGIGTGRSYCSVNGTFTEQFAPVAGALAAR
jgi:hypothetical protein